MEETKKKKYPPKKKFVKKDEQPVQQIVEDTKPEKQPWDFKELRDIDVAKKMLKIFQSAQDRNLEFNLSFETVKRLITYPTCYYTGRVFENDGIYSRSFDRVDSAKGYVEGNVVACTIDINQKKSNLSESEIFCLYDKLIKFKESNAKPQRGGATETEQPVTSQPQSSLDTGDSEGLSTCDQTGDLGGDQG